MSILAEMTAPNPPEASATESFTCHVFRGMDLRVTSGANLRDPLAEVEEVCLGDIYQLAEAAEVWPLALTQRADTGVYVLAETSDLGRSGAPMVLTGRLTFMAPDGDKIEVVIIELPEAEEHICFLPLSPIEPRTDYTLIGASEDPGDVQLSDLISIAFVRGTAITLADGSQRAVEDLAPGDRVLTRDHGPQPLRWVGKQTMRAVGAYAPVVISKDALGNASDLIVSQHQRLFVYQRGADRLAKTAELLVRAALLVDDDQIFIRKGGFADYFTLVFDRHEVIYAECIPAESLQVSAANRTALPEDIAREVGERFPDLDHTQAFGTDVADEDLGDAVRSKLLKGN